MKPDSADTVPDKIGVPRAPDQKSLFVVWSVVQRASMWEFRVPRRRNDLMTLASPLNEAAGQKRKENIKSEYRELYRLPSVSV